MLLNEHQWRQRKGSTAEDERATASALAGARRSVANRGAMWHQDESGRVHTPFEPIVLAATLSLIPILIIEADAKSEAWQTFATVANWIIWTVFVTELVAVLVVAKRKRAALRAHWLDLAIVVLTIPLLSKALAWLRLARFIRLPYGAHSNRQ